MSLPDGTILLLAGVFLKTSITPKPTWFDTTFRLAFGPGARSGVSIWRSIDCGISFQWISDLDPADPAFENGDCGLPQLLTYSPVDPRQRWDMGGTDGQKALVRAGRPGGDLFLVHQCVGYRPQAGATSFALDPSNPVNQALVFRSRDQGKNWEIAVRLSPTSFPGEVWRGDLVLRARIAALTNGRDSGLYVAPFSEQPLPALIMPPRLNPFPNQPVSYNIGDSDFPKNGNALTNCTTAICGLLKRDPSLSTNFLYHTVMVPFGARRLVLSAFASVISRGPGQESANGYFVYFLDVATGDAFQLDSVLPEAGNEHESFIAFLTMVPDGHGSALLYWYDVDARSGQARIRGRHISPRFQTEDFDISRSGGVSRSWSYSDNGWYGDYHEAGGYSFFLPRSLFARSPTLRHSYFPAWADGQQQTRTAQVIVDEPTLAGRPIDEILLLSQD